MKKVFNNLVFIVLSVFYCLAMNTVEQTADASSQKPHCELTGKAVASFSKTSDRLFLATTELKLSGSSIKNSSSNNLRLPQVIYSANNTIQALCSLHRSLHYLKYSKELLIRFRKADLIFPFHYFW